MIGRLHGKLLEKHPPMVLVDVNGIGYEVDVPMSTFYTLPANGETVTLLTHFVVREDAQLLYGFATAEERQTFRQLLKISGVGAKMALAVLSGLSAQELATAVMSGDAVRLTKVPGIGKKTAERLVVELRDRAGAAGDALPGAGASNRPLTPLMEARSALEALGYKPVDAQRMADAVKGEGLSAEHIIREALRRAVR